MVVPTPDRGIHGGASSRPRHLLNHSLERWREMTNKVAFGWHTDEFFQRFELIEQIGVGGFATVHRAVDKLSKELVAVKVRKHSPPSEKSPKLFFRACAGGRQDTILPC